MPSEDKVQFANLETSSLNIPDVEGKTAGKKPSGLQKLLYSVIILTLLAGLVIGLWFLFSPHYFTRQSIRYVSSNPTTPKKENVDVSVQLKDLVPNYIWAKFSRLLDTLDDRLNDKISNVVPATKLKEAIQPDSIVKISKLVPAKQASETYDSRVAYSVPSPVCSNINDEEKYDCQPDGIATEESCTSRRCCWLPSDKQLEGNRTGYPPLKVPYCFYPSNYVGYHVESNTALDDRSVIDLLRVLPSGFKNDVQRIRVEVINYGYEVARIKIYDPLNQRYEVPVPPIPDASVQRPIAYKADVSNDGELVIRRTESPATPVFQANLSRVVFSEQFVQLSTRLPSRVLYGLGERRGPLQKDINWARYVFLNRDRFPDYNINLYGTHPFYIILEDGGKSHGVFLHNSNPMEVILQPAPAATFRSIGGILDFYVFMGPTPSQVVKQYQRLVGFPRMPPYWSLGFQLCKWGYGSLNETRAVYERNIKAGIPLDVQWNDIDYMDKYNDFTYDKDKFAGLPEFVDYVHSQDRKYVIILDPGVSGSEKPGTYPPYDDGVAMDIFVKNISGGISYGKVWNLESTVFPDFTHPDATSYWTQQFKNLHDEVKFDGAWIDMNEPSNEHDGTTPEGCPNSPLEDPQYVPGGEPLRSRTICMTDKHHVSNHYDVHNTYSYYEALATYKALTTVKGTRPFIISRATYAGQGHWSGHWSGDIYSDWSNLKDSISNILEMGLYGIPQMGADICGFNGNTTEELCARWQALGAFYPFSRNHNSIDMKDQDPAAMGDLVINATKGSLELRYYLLPYLYTLFHYSHTAGETVFRPLFMEFPDDPNTYSIDTQFLWGSSFLINPALEPNQTEVVVYFPKGRWYDLRKGTLYKSNGQNVTLPAPFDYVNILQRGGSIIPAIKPSLTTAESRRKPFELVVAPDDNQIAKGTLYWDDGESLNTVERGNYNLVDFVLVKNALTVSSRVSGYDSPMMLDQIHIFGIDSSPKTVLQNGRPANFTFYDSRNILGINNINSSMKDDLVFVWTD